MRQGKPKTIGKITGKTYCFTAGTPVLLPDGMKPIEEVRKGDWVWSTDQGSGELEEKRVEEVFVNETDEIVHVRYGDTEIDATPNHPFYIPDRGWVSAVNLRAGDRLQLVNGEYVTVEQVQHEILESPVKVYNFEVQDNHTYYVGGDDDDSAVLVHNKCKVVQETIGTGQRHHLLSRRVMRKIEQSKIKGLFERNDLIAIAKDKFAHRGYQRWHREFDQAIEEWLVTPGRKVTEDKFIRFLNQLYSSEEAVSRFGVIKVVKR